MTLMLNCSHMRVGKNKQTGFTIVELLIVIVVIAILAAITIVAYNGIQNRAKASWVQSEASQQAKKLAMWKVENNNTYPADLAAAQAAGMLINNGDLTYTKYLVNSDASYYCATGQIGTTKYSVTSSGSGSAQGECVVNLAQNPSFETGTAGVTVNVNGTTGTNSVETGGAFSGNNFFRRTFTAASTGMNVGPYQQITGLSQDKSYYMRVAVKSNTNVAYRIIAERRNASGTAIGGLAGSTVTIDGDNTWRQLELQVPPTPSMERMTFTVYSATSSWSSGTVVDFDGFFIAEGTGPFGYADGSNANWIWNGTAHGSTSTGPVGNG